MADRPRPQAQHVPNPARPDSDDVPDVVLEELLAAFSAEDGGPIDFDDPSIDRILGVSDSADSTAGNVDPDTDTDPDTDVAVDETGGLDQTAAAGSTDALTSSNTIALDTGTKPPEDAASPPEPGSANPDSEAANASRKVIVIGDDDLPDAVYLDEESGSRLRDVHAGDSDTPSGRSTIIIDDLDESGSIEALPARSSGSMDPRVRARRIAVRRAKGRKRLIWVAIAAAILLVLVGAVAVLASSVFDVRTIDVQGAVYTDPQQLSSIVDQVRGDAILLVDTRSVERQLEAIAWVESARVSTQFPHTVFIDIRERKPIATFAGSDGKFRVIDRDGRVLDVVDGVPIDYMLVTGANPDTDRGQFAGRPFASAAQLAIALPSEIRALTRSIGVDATAGDLTLRLGDKLDVQLGPATDMSAKLVRLLSEVRGGIDATCALDVSTSEISRTAC
ncbi:MAG: cell division protein FtsQ [Ilumatobacteraceae bacterium]|jgi:cell division protein FtsQ